MKKTTPLLFALAVLPLLGGCALDPVDKKPESAVSPAWNAAKGDAKAILRTDWWKDFADPKLDGVVELAYKNSPDIDSAYSKVRAARAAAGLADSGFWPTLGVGGSYSRQHYSESNLSSSVAGHTTGNYGVGGAVGYEVDLWGRVRNNADAADAEYRSSHADLAGARLLVAGEVVKLWFDLRQAKVERGIVADELGARTALLDFLKAREEAGMISDDQVARAGLLASQSRVDLDELELKISTLRNALVAVVGVPAVPEPAETTPESVPVMPVTVPSEVIRNRPDLASADLRLDAALLREGASRANYYPNLTLSASGGFSSINAGDLFKNSSAVWNFGPTLSLPIFTGGKNDADLEKARARFDAAWAGYRRAVLAAFRETEDALVAVDRLRSREKFTVAVVSDAEKVYANARERSLTGMSSELDVVIASRDALEARRALVKVRFDRLRAAAGLALTLGGGWNREVDIGRSSDEFEARLVSSDRASPDAARN